MNKESTFASANHHFSISFITQLSYLPEQIFKILFRRFYTVFGIEKISLIIFLLILTGSLHAQISPPGLGEANTALWAAFGVKQQLDSLGKKHALSYIGMGRKSSLDNYNPASKQAIIVLNHEVSHSFTTNQQYSYAVSYRRQPKYESSSPYEKETTEQEVRIYGRYAYTFNLSERWKLKNTVRQEFRKFFDADFRKAEENFQLRTRIKSQLTYNLSKKNKQKLALSAEGLFAASYLNNAEQPWTSFGYKELRVGVFYMFSLPHSPFTVDIGYVNNLIRGSRSVKKGGVHYIAADLIWNLPFKK